MRFARSPTVFFWGGLIACLLFFSNLLMAAPSTFALETFISITGSDNQRLPLSGIYDIQFELIKPDDTVVFTKNYTSVIALGILSVSIEEEDNLDSTLFKDHLLSAKITISGSGISTQSNLNLGIASFTNTEVITLPIHSVARTIQSDTATATRSFLNENLIKFEEPSLNVSIATTNIKSRLHVGGTLKATSFIGDASNLLDMDYIRWTRVTNPERIFYDTGFVGIGTMDPKTDLHVSGNLQVTQNQQSQSIGVNPLLTIRDTLEATFRGEAPLVSNLNATNISHGTVQSERLFGAYPNITGIGTISSGIWNSTSALLQDDAISNQLSIVNSSFENSSLSGDLTRTNALTVVSNSVSYPLIINPNGWILSEDAGVQSISTSELVLNGSTFEYPSTLNIITTNDQVFKLSPTGQFTFPDTPIVTEFNPSQSIRVGTTADASPGTIRLNTYFEGHTPSGWHRLDKSGIFTGHSLYPENNLTTPLLNIKSNGNIGIGIQNPLDSFVTSGNVVFLGNPSADDIAYIGDGDYLLWVSNRGALVIGNGEMSTNMFLKENIGTSSVTIGNNAISSGFGAVNISSPTVNSVTKASADYSVLIGSTDSDLTGINLIALASTQINGFSSPGVVMSAKGMENAITGDQNIVFNGINPSSTYANGFIGGQNLSSPLGNNSFMWDLYGRGRHLGSNIHNSFVTGPQIKVGINSNSFSTDPTEILVVGGHVSANALKGSGHLLTGDIRTEYLNVLIAGVTENIAPTLNKDAQYIYVSDLMNSIPENTVLTQTISDGSIEGSNFNSYSLDSHKIVDNSVDTENFQNGAIQTNHLNIDDLPGRVFSNIDGDNIEDNAISDVKLATDSIYTLHFVDEAVTMHHISENMVNSTNIAVNNIALHAIADVDILPEQLPSNYFATESATGINIAHEVLSTTMSGDTIDESYFVYEIPAGTPSPQIQEQHINSDAVKSYHIPTNSIYSRHLGYGEISTVDFTSDQTPGIQVADERTVNDVVFQGRHFVNNSVTNSKFFDDCPSPTCATPTENFQLTSEQIGPDALAYDGELYDEITDGAVVLRHISPKAIVGRHIKNRSIQTIKFQDNSVESQHIAEDSVSSLDILDHTLTQADFSLRSIEGVHIVARSITSRELADDAISSQNIGESIIDSSHIIDKTLGKNDFAPGAFTPDKIRNGTIVSDNIAANAILENHLGDFELSPEKFKDHGVHWNNFIPPPEGGFPMDRFGDNTLDFSAKFLSTDDIHGSKITTASITAEQVNIPTFNVSKLVVPLDVSKGGTGLTSFIPDAILYAYTDSIVKMGQTTQFLWNSSNARLTIGTPTSIPAGFTSGIITTGNVLISDGALLLNQHSTTHYTFVKYNPTDSAIQLSYNSPLSSNQSNMGVKTKKLMGQTSLVIGNSAQTNEVDLSSGLRLGSTYVSNDTSPPTNGLIVEGPIQINDVSGNIKQASELNGYGLIVDRETTDGVIHATSANIGILSDITGGQGHLSSSTSEKLDETPIWTSGRSINAEGVIGIETASPIPMRVTMSATIGEVTGIQAIMVTENPTTSAAAFHTELTGTGITEMTDAIGYASPTFTAGIYGQSSNTTRADNYAGVFDGNFLAKSMTNSDTTPDQALEISTMFIEGLNYHKTQTSIINTIDWRHGSIVNINVDNNPRNIVFSHKPDESAKLLVVVEHSGTGELTFSDGSILWHSGYAPELTAVTDTVDIVVFYYDKNLDKYFGSAAYNFRTP